MLVVLVVLTFLQSILAAAPIADASLLTALDTPILLRGNDRIAYRDPLLIHAGGTFRLFHSLVREEEDRLIYWYVAVSTSSNLRDWSAPRVLTAKNQNLNYSSPGNIVRVGDEWILCLQTYPIANFRRGDRLRFADERARLFLMRSRDLETWSEPELIRIKGPDIGQQEMGKMIDPFLLRDKDEPGKWWGFYKQDGRVQLAWSRDLATWKKGQVNITRGENPCVIVDGADYVLFYAPANGVGVKRSPDLIHWREETPPLTFGQKDWPWAEARLTAGYVEDLRAVPGVARHVMVFHTMGPGRIKTDANTNANCHVLLAWSPDLQTWDWPGKK